MSTPILKPDRDRDLYVLWSTNVDNVVGLVVVTTEPLDIN